jgi:hypothetical protein
MVRTVSRALLACLFALLFVLPAAAIADQSDPAVQVVLAQQTTAPAGPDIPPAPTTQDGANTRNKLVIGVAAAVLLGIVIIGHRARSKRQKDSGGS